jgi:hypothetical protein
MIEEASSGEEIFYRMSPANEGLVFAAPGDALENHAIRTALASSKTWGDFRRAIGELNYRAVINAMSRDVEAPIKVPSDDDRLDLNKIPGFNDGEYPEWLQRNMHRLLPADVLAKFGEQTSTMFNGMYVHLDASYEKHIVSALRKRGYRVHRREDLFFT